MILVKSYVRGGECEGECEGQCEGECEWGIKKNIVMSLKLPGIES